MAAASEAPGVASLYEDAGGDLGGAFAEEGSPSRESGEDQDQQARCRCRVSLRCHSAEGANVRSAELDSSGSHAGNASHSRDRFGASRSQSGSWSLAFGHHALSVVIWRTVPLNACIPLETPAL